MSGIDVGVVFLDKDAVIRSLSEKAKRFFDMSDADIDRPIEDIGSRFGIGELPSLIKQTSLDTEFEDRIVKNRTGEQFMLRIVPKKGMNDSRSLIIDFDGSAQSDRSAMLKKIEAKRNR